MAAAAMTNVGQAEEALAAVVADGWQVTRLAGALGAEVRGLDLAKATPEDAKKVMGLLAEHAVLFFPDQHHLTKDQHMAFGHLIGPTAGHPADPNPLAGELLQLQALKSQDRPIVVDEWHTDLTCEVVPPVCSILRIVKCPKVGGDTMFANLCAAYDALSPPMKDLCDGLTALHDANTHGMPEKMAIHPVVRKHPVTGKKLLYVNNLFTKRIVEMSAEESRVLLTHLQSWVHDPRFTIRYHWTEGTVGIWDNRQTMHCVVNDFDPELDGERVVHRCTVQGIPAAGDYTALAGIAQQLQPEAANDMGNPPRWDPFPGRHQEDRPLIQFLRKVGRMPGMAKL